MSNICILIPTYPPRYEHLNNLLTTYTEFGLDQQSDICFVLASKQDRGIFKKQVGNYRTIVLPEGIDPAGGREIINIKKFYGVKKLASKYEYIIVLDDDARFCKKTDIEKVCRDYFKRKILISSESNGDDKIALEAAHACKRFFRNHEKRDILDDKGLLWFNQPCIYRSSDMKDFFEITEIDKWWTELTQFDFDYLVYMYYLILCKDFEVRPCGIRADISAAELTSNKNYERVSDEYKNLVFYCASQHMQSILPSEEVFILWHYDREPMTKKVVKKGLRWFFKAGFMKSSIILKSFSDRIELQ